jgi:hypothetical protein
MSWRTALTQVDRVRSHTATDGLDAIDRALEERLDSYRDASDAAITERLETLDTEWDIERTLEVNAASLASLGITASLLLRRRWLLALPLTVGLFLLQHGIQGWCPPLTVFRRRQVRTRREIDLERYALKAIRGDFTGGQRPAVDDVSGLLEDAARR